MIEQLFDIIIFNEINGKNNLWLQRGISFTTKTRINIVINAELLIKTENNGRAVNSLDEKKATVASEICRSRVTVKSAESCGRGPQISRNLVVTSKF
jgi:hypothetical protein